jgi:hypothetical protein
VLKQISAVLVQHGYRTHEFGDSLLAYRQLLRSRQVGT